MVTFSALPRTAVRRIIYRSIVQDLIPSDSSGIHMQISSRDTWTVSDFYESHLYQPRNYKLYDFMLDMKVYGSYRMSEKKTLSLPDPSLECFASFSFSFFLPVYDSMFISFGVNYLSCFILTLALDPVFHLLHHYKLYICPLLFFCFIVL